MTRPKRPRSPAWAKRVLGLWIIVAGIGSAPVGAAASTVTQPLHFTVAPPTNDLPWFFHYDVGYADRATEALANDGVEQAVGVDGPLPFGFRARGRLAVGFQDQADTHVAWDAELLRTLIGDASDSNAFHLALGAGTRREWEGTYVAVGRVSAGKALGALNFFGNLCLERPFASDRDELDLITTLASTWQVTKRTSVGLEVVGEDWEGLWESEEAEGGAKIVAGPTIGVQPWERLVLSLIAGPIFHVTTTDPPDASRASDGDVGVIVRLSIGYAF